MSSYTLTLNYQLRSGWLQPYTDGLIQGQAMAWSCTKCRRSSFPPVRTCTCGQTTGKWITLTGRARVIHYTFGQDGEFALVQFDGADTSSVVKLSLPIDQPADPATELTGTLCAPDSDSPELVLQINPISEMT